MRFILFLLRCYVLFWPIAASAALELLYIEYLYKSVLRKGLSEAENSYNKIFVSGQFP